ncbi:GAF domain-containing protein [Pacificibacter maritimus]|uniref:histidine kinase n=1 Tax=Pacificibacter maritimus TaxID=762213 RepID=A0A3N4UH87_9RHOB|nr:ATP-binding protein [Pacificibacter maritimus]RPE66539.1 GAF domain-containing protein [Pacificibacter maritimus]
MHFTLEELGLVDADPEESFDNLTSLATELIGVPVAHISIADLEKDRIYYKSQVGHPPELVDLRQLPMGMTYCQHVYLTRAPVIVTDAYKHPLLIGTPALSPEQPLAYLGIPIEAPSGEVLGGLCMMQPDKRLWTDDEIARATKIAGCVSDVVRLKAAMLTSERLRREQQEFTYAISHDLKSPANTIGMILEEINEDRDKLCADNQILVDEGLETVARMGRHVEDVLTYSRTVGAKEDFAQVDLNTILNDVLRNLKADILATSAQIECDPLPTIYGLQNQLLMLFQNLIANAIKFQKPNTVPQVKVSVETQNGMHTIKVSDNGIGIRPEDQSQVFGLFSRLNLRETYGGTGIGLSLCKRVAENHQAAIMIESNGISGSTFALQFAEKVDG